MSEALAIVQVGLCCPVGLTTAQTATAIRAGVSRKRKVSLAGPMFAGVKLGYLDDEHLPELDPRLAPAEGSTPGLEHRLLRLASAPLQEVLAGCPHRSPPPLYLAGPQPAPEQPELISASFLGRVAVQSGQALDVAKSRLFATGRAGVFAALAAAQAELGSQRSGFVIVGGVDSYYDVARTAMLDEEGRLRRSRPRDSFTPGEAAAFVLLGTRASCLHHGVQPLAWIPALGLGHEPGHRYSELPFLGEGLAAAFAATFEQLRGPLDPIRLVLAGFNGERMFNQEWSVASLRNHEHFAQQVRLEHAAEFMGDAGAALAPLMLGSAAFHMHAGTAAGPALLWASSDQGQRGALLMHAHT